MANSADSDQLASSTDLNLHCLQSQSICRLSRTRVYLCNSCNQLFLCPLIGWCRGHIVFRFSVHGYVHTNILLSVQMYVCTRTYRYIRDPVRLRLRHLYQVEFCSFIVGYFTLGASVYCGHISSFLIGNISLSAMSVSKDTSALGPLYKTVHYKMVSDIRHFKGGPKTI